MLRECRKCGAIFGAIACACVGGGEFIGHIKSEREVRLYISDQPHVPDDEPKAPSNNRAITVAAVSTASNIRPQGWLSIPASISSSTSIWWQPPPI